MTKKALEDRKGIVHEALQIPWPEDFPKGEQHVHEIRMIEACHYDPEDTGAYVRRMYYEDSESGARGKYEIIGASKKEFHAMAQAAGITFREELA